MSSPVLLSTPLEVRLQIYSKCIGRSAITVRRNGTLDLEGNQFQLRSVCKQINDETQPIVQNTQIELRCEDGCFPDSIRRRLPRHVFDRIVQITIVDRLLVDELRPTLRAFPNLERIKFRLRASQTDETHLPCLARGWASEVSSDHEFLTETVYLFDGAAIERNPTHYAFEFTAWLKSMYVEQQEPREGLERDYMVENSLFQILRLGRGRRRFEMDGTIRIDRFDSTGQSASDLATGSSFVLPLKLEEYMERELREEAEYLRTISQLDAAFEEITWT